MCKSFYSILGNKKLFLLLFVVTVMKEENERREMKAGVLGI